MDKFLSEIQGQKTKSFCLFYLYARSPEPPKNKIS